MIPEALLQESAKQKTRKIEELEKQLEFERNRALLCPYEELFFEPGHERWEALCALVEQNPKTAEQITIAPWPGKSENAWKVTCCARPYSFERYVWNGLLEVFK